MLLSQLFLELVIVTNNAIMHEGDAAAMIEMWMSIEVGLVTMGCPSCMADSDIMVMPGGALHAHTLDAVTAETT